MSLTWTPDMSTGVMQFDDEHRQLVALYNELFDATSANQPVSVLADILDRLLAQTCDHFRREEELMRQTGYPRVAEHEAEHDRLVTELSNVRHRLLGGTKSAIDAETLAFLDRWLVVHTVEMDRDYGPHLNAHGIH